MDWTIAVWVAGVVVFVVLEAVTYQLVSIWFALGAVAGMIARIAGADFTVQFAIFLAVSALSLVCLCPVSKKLIKHSRVQTNVDSLIGEDVLILSDTNKIEGTGKVGGMVWSVRSCDGQKIQKGETAAVTSIEGVKLIVKRKED